MTLPLNKTTKFIILGLLIIGLTAIFLFKLQDRMTDFKVFDRAGERVIKGEMLYQLSDGHYAFKYPAFFAFMVAPITVLPFILSQAIWCLLICTAIVLYLRFGCLILKVENKQCWRVLILTILILAKFYGRELDLGQANAIMGCFLLMMTWFVSVKRETPAGIFLALAVIVKPYSLIFFPYFLLRKYYRLVGIAAWSLIIAFLFPVVRYGYNCTIQLHAQWLITLSHSTPRLCSNVDNVSLIGMLVKWFGGYDTMVFTIWIGLIIIIFAIFVWMIFLKKDISNRSLSLEISLLLLFIPLFSPLGWDYTFIIAAFGVMTLLTYWNELPIYIVIPMILNLILIGGTFYDVMGAGLYSKFMKSSILTVNYLAIMVTLGYLRFQQRHRQPFVSREYGQVSCRSIRR